MSKKSKALATIFSIILLVSIGAVYYRYLIVEDVPYQLDEEAFQAALLEE